MGILGWIVVGFVAGGLARWVTGARKRGCLATIVVGILGALIGGALFRLASGDEVETFDDFDLGSIFVAFVGAALLLLVLEAVSPRDRR
ncbi:MAG TPA: GlsB/YeaQ/YmgE family stress response membrane protein [Acidimicrobiales bacterium]|nr:GlsB/YeaQ/YmgE family stress response membrane protein [Acidimicrobiales bacterium]